MKKLLTNVMATIAVGGVLAGAVSNAGATTLSGNMTADNAFFAYVSDQNTTLGAPIGSGNAWWDTFHVQSNVLKPGVTNYLHIEVINYGGPYSLIGSFGLSDNHFHFANGTQTLSTDTNDWSAVFNNGNANVAPQPWVAPGNGNTVDFGNNGVGPWGFHPQIAPNAEWIGVATNVNCGFCTLDYSAAIYSNQAANVPEPASLMILGTGFVGLGVARRRKKKAV